MSQRELRTAFRLDIADATGIIGNLFRLTRASVFYNFISTRSCVLLPIVSLGIIYRS